MVYNFHGKVVESKNQITKVETIIYVSDIHPLGKLSNLPIISDTEKFDHNVFLEVKWVDDAVKKIIFNFYF